MVEQLNQHVRRELAALVPAHALHVPHGGGVLQRDASHGARDRHGTVLEVDQELHPGRSLRRLIPPINHSSGKATRHHVP